MSDEKPVDATWGKQGEWVKFDKHEEPGQCCGGGRCCGDDKFNELYDEASKEPEAPYEPTEEESEDLERRFFLMYHLKVSWETYDLLSRFEQDWLIQRFLHQKKMEKEIMHQQRTGGGILIPQPSLEI